MDKVDASAVWAAVFTAATVGVTGIIGALVKRFTPEYETQQKRARAEADAALWERLRALGEQGEKDKAELRRQAEADKAEMRRQAEADKAELKQQITDVRAELQATRESNDRLRGDYARVAGERDDQRARADGAEQARDTEHARAIHAEQERDVLQQQVEELGARVAALETHVAKLEQRRDDTGAPATGERRAEEMP